MARIVSVYIDTPNENDRARGQLFAHNMAYGRWLKMAAALARQGHRVDVAVPDVAADWPCDWGFDSAQGALRPVPLSAIDWQDYDVVKTAFHRGFDTLERYGGSGHPCIIAKLGSVVSDADREGIYFYGEERAWLYGIQQRIARHARHVAVLSPPARDLWVDCHGRAEAVLLVPGGADAEIPPPGPDPYPADGRKRCVFAGNVYGRGSQPQANRTLIDKLNRLGEHLVPAGVRLFLLGFGNSDRLDPHLVTHLPPVSLEACWDYLHHADVGIVVSAGAFMHNNESTKLYHYLRAGLPVVSERGFPNDHVLTDSGGGVLIGDEDMVEMARRIRAEAQAQRPMLRAVRHVLERHTWDHRAERYRAVIG
jgi:hypothetical protein